MSVHTSSREQRTDRRQLQRMTGGKAHRYEQPWTSTEDRELLHGDGTVAHRALRLGRTYYAAQQRLTVLRRRLAAARQADQ